MRLIFAGVIAILLFVTGCTNQYKVPRDILPQEKMENVLWDMIMADRYATIFLSRDSSKNVREEAFTLYEQIFSIHKITRQEFVKSMKFYLDRPDISQVMLDSLATKANRKRDEIYKSSTPSTPTTPTTPPSTPFVPRSK